MSRILLVDDDADIRVLVQQVLGLNGHEVYLASDANSAMRLTGTVNFDGVLSDANMPEMNGYELVKHLRTLKRYKTVPIALITGRREKKDVERALRAGVDDYIVKPIDPALLVTKVTALLSKRPPEMMAEIRFTGPIAQSPQAQARILKSIALKSVSEYGVSFETNEFFADGELIYLELNLFTELGIPTPAFKVLTVQKNPKNTKHLVHALYMGATDAQLQKLRAWINATLLKQKFSEDGAA